jgi:hypothetical protein
MTFGELTIGGVFKAFPGTSLVKTSNSDDITLGNAAYLEGGESRFYFLGKDVVETTGEIHFPTVIKHANHNL